MDGSGGHFSSGVALSSLDSAQQDANAKQRDGDEIVEDNDEQYPLKEEGDAVSLLCAGPRLALRFFNRHPFTIIEILIWLLYYIVGIVYYSAVEGWSTQQCIYFITVTFSTVGYGQFGPTTDDSRIFTAFYCIFGILCVLTAINRAATKWLIKLQKPTLDFFLGKGVHKPSTKITFSIIIVGLVLFTGLFSFAALENWDYATSFYWTVTTMTSVGYGDLMVTTEAARKFGVFFIYLCVFVYSLAIQNIFNSFQDIRDKAKRRTAVEDIQRSGIFKSTMQITSLNEFVSEDDCAEFVLMTLLRMKKVDIVDDCEPIIKFWLQQRDAVIRHPIAMKELVTNSAAKSDAPGSSKRKGLRDSFTDTPYSRELHIARRCGDQKDRVDNLVGDFLAMKEQRQAVERAALKTKRDTAPKAMRAMRDDVEELGPIRKL